jgi:hypothetical protein
LKETSYCARLQYPYRAIDLFDTGVELERKAELKWEGVDVKDKLLDIVAEPCINMTSTPPSVGTAFVDRGKGQRERKKRRIFSVVGASFTVQDDDTVTFSAVLDKVQYCGAIFVDFVTVDVDDKEELAFTFHADVRPDHQIYSCEEEVPFSLTQALDVVTMKVRVSYAVCNCFYHLRADDDDDDSDALSYTATTGVRLEKEDTTLVNDEVFHIFETELTESISSTTGEFEGLEVCPSDLYARSASLHFGACCGESGECEDSVSSFRSAEYLEANCTETGGSFTSGSVCAAVKCTPKAGLCCVRHGDEFVEVPAISRAECEELKGLPTNASVANPWFPADDVDDDDDCMKLLAPPVQGSCVTRGPPYCEDRSGDHLADLVAQCLDDGGFFADESCPTVEKSGSDVGLCCRPVGDDEHSYGYTAVTPGDCCDATCRWNSTTAHCTHCVKDHRFLVNRTWFQGDGDDECTSPRCEVECSARVSNRRFVGACTIGRWGVCLDASSVNERIARARCERMYGGVLHVDALCPPVDDPVLGCCDLGGNRSIPDVSVVDCELLLGTQLLQQPFEKLDVAAVDDVWQPACS